MLFIFIFLWLMCSTIYFLGYSDLVNNLKPKEKGLAIFVFIIGGPSFLIVSALSAILDNIFPDGWDDE